MSVLVDQRRVRKLNTTSHRRSSVVYWMLRDQRVTDNWALLYAQELALEYRVPLVVVFCFVPNSIHTMGRQMGFIVNGLQEIAVTLHRLQIEFRFLVGQPSIEIPRLIEEIDAGALVTDFSPLKIVRDWKSKVASASTVPCYEVDTHNVVPCWLASPKREFAAATFRPKIQRLLSEFLTNFPVLQKHPYHRDSIDLQQLDYHSILRKHKINVTNSYFDWIKPGERAARYALDGFLEKRLHGYAIKRNDPSENWQSNLSPYLHFGHLAPQRVAYEVNRLNQSISDQENFLEELIVRRELSDNFCFYNKDYDNVGGFPSWAKASLDAHRSDARDHQYSMEQFENGKTHDQLWNAAQFEMLHTGKMHGYMRMYWAKKILEWTSSPEEAMDIAISLNDRYEFDGCDPNGYTGIAWSIGGVHDRAWFDRPVFGKVRYMNANGCRRKFDVERYIEMQRQ